MFIRSWISVSLIALFASKSFAQLPNCGGRIRIRYEWSDLPRAEQVKYLDAVSKLHRERRGFEHFAQKHVEHFNAWHKQPVFLPAHRAMLSEFEEALRRIEPDVVLPYWDQSKDYQNPLRASIWRDFGTVTTGSCVTDGYFANWALTYPGNHCLTRNSTGNDWPLDSPQEIRSIITGSGSFERFFRTLEDFTHMRLHVLVGGASGSGDMVFAFSPNDPIFMIHHAYMDKLWNNFQLLDRRFFDDYVGNANQAIAGYSIRVRDVFETRNLCFVYAEPGTQYMGNYVSNPSSSARPTSTRQSTRVSTSTRAAVTSRVSSSRPGSSSATRSATGTATTTQTISNSRTSAPASTGVPSSSTAASPSSSNPSSGSAAATTTTQAPISEPTRLPFQFQPPKNLTWGNFSKVEIPSLRPVPKPIVNATETNFAFDGSDKPLTGGGSYSDAGHKISALVSAFSLIPALIIAII
ncbi:hypothetical protein MP638_005063 [Amoeboaphelidium occidentale]|nr:hypothetical protein MP638_005063 [Amoeboaphelidium occidentale]